MMVQTKIGFGPVASGEIEVLGETGASVNSSQIDFTQEGKILLFLCPVSRSLLEKASLVGAIGAIVPSMHFRDYDYFQGLKEFPLLVVLKFGNLDLDSEMTEKLRKLAGKKGKLDGEKKTFDAG